MLTQLWLNLNLFLCKMSSAHFCSYVCPHKKKQQAKKKLLFFCSLFTARKWRAFQRKFELMAPSQNKQRKSLCVTVSICAVTDLTAFLQSSVFPQLETLLTFSHFHSFRGRKTVSVCAGRLVDFVWTYSQLLNSFHKFTLIFLDYSERRSVSLYKVKILKLQCPLMSPCKVQIVWVSEDVWV